MAMVTKAVLAATVLKVVTVTKAVLEAKEATVLKVVMVAKEATVLKVVIVAKEVTELTVITVALAVQGRLRHKATSTPCSVLKRKEGLTPTPCKVKLNLT